MDAREKIKIKLLELAEVGREIRELRQELVLLRGAKRRIKESLKEQNDGEAEGKD